MTDGLPVNTQRQRVVGFQRRHSLCPVTLPNSKFNNGSVEPVAEPTGWPLSSGNQQWSREFQQQLPRSSLNHIPFRVDRSVSMIEGNVGSLGSREHQLPTPPPPSPPPPPILPPPSPSPSLRSSFSHPPPLITQTRPTGRWLSPLLPLTDTDSGKFACELVLLKLSGLHNGMGLAEALSVCVWLADPRAPPAHPAS